MHYSLNDINPGESATIEALDCTGSIKRRLIDIGLIENTEIECVGKSPFGDPKAFLIRGAVIAIRHDICSKIRIKNVGEVKRAIDKKRREKRQSRIRLGNKEK